MPERTQLLQKARDIRMVLLDVDGVMTDGGLYYSAEGIELKRFHAHDGYGITRSFASGLRVGIVSGRSTPIIDARAKALRIEDVFQGVDNKLTVLPILAERHHLAPQEFAYIGDDLFDIPLLQAVGFSGAPANARREVKEVVDYVTTAPGGEGAVREFLDLLLRLRAVGTTP